MARSHKGPDAIRPILGINTFRGEAQVGQLSRARNVWEDEGDLQTRPGFRAVSIGARHWRAHGRSALFLLDAGTGTPGYFPARATTLTAANLDPATRYMGFGATEPFAGVEIRHISLANNTPTQSLWAHVEYWTGSAWVALGQVIDTTILRVGAGDYMQSFQRNGVLAWHSSAASGWSTITRSGVPYYIVRIPFRPAPPGEGGTATAPEFDITFFSSGPRVFDLEPVRSLLPYRTKEGQSVVVAASDRQPPRGVEPGAAVSLYRGPRVTPEMPLLVDDEGAGSFGLVSPKAPVDRGPEGLPWGSLSWINVTPVGGSEGVYDTLIKNRRQDTPNGYEWTPGQFRGALLLRGLVPTAVAADFLGGTVTVPVPSNYSDAPADYFEHCRLVVTGRVAGPAIGEEKEVYASTAVSGGSVTLSYHFSFSAAPDLNNVFELRLPSGVLRCNGHAREYDVRDVNVTTTDGITISAGERYASDPVTADDNSYVHWQVGQYAQHRIPSGRFWQGVFDVTTRKVLLSNERSGLLEFDGLRLRRFSPTSDDSSARVRQWVGELPDQARDLLQGAGLAGSKLRAQVPSARFMVDFRGRTVLGVPPYRVVWSAPSPDSDIWPKLYETQIRDARNKPMSAMFVHDTMLCVSTAVSIHTSTAPGDDGLFRLNPTTQGMGFVAQRAVLRLNQGLTLGVTPDGLAQFNGYQIAPILDDWRRILPEGVNTARLDDAVGMVSFHGDRVFVAVPSSGSLVNDRLIVIDLDGWPTPPMWVWDVPFGGIASMSSDVDDGGEEELLFGMNDGTICALHAGDDDGTAVSWHARTAPLDAGMARMVIAGVHVKATYSGRDVTCRCALDEGLELSDRTQALAPAGAGVRAVWDLDAYDETGATYRGDHQIVESFNTPSGARGESAEIELRGTARVRVRSVKLRLGEPVSERSR